MNAFTVSFAFNCVATPGPGSSSRTGSLLADPATATGPGLLSWAFADTDSTPSPPLGWTWVRGSGGPRVGGVGGLGGRWCGECRRAGDSLRSASASRGRLGLRPRRARKASISLFADDSSRWYCCSFSRRLNKAGSGSGAMVRRCSGTFV